MTTSEALSESADLRKILIAKEDQLVELRNLSRELLGAYKGTLTHGGAILATHKDTNPLIAKAEDLLGILR